MRIGFLELRRGASFCGRENCGALTPLPRRGQPRAEMPIGAALPRDITVANAPPNAGRPSRRSWHGAEVAPLGTGAPVLADGSARQITRTLIAWLIAALAAIIHAGAASACSGHLPGAARVDATYAPFEAVNTSKEFAITVQNTGAMECVFWLGGWRSTAGAEPAALGFDVKGRDGAWSSAGAASPTAPAWLASRRLAPNESHNFALILGIPAGQLLPPGDYLHTFETILHATPDAQPPQNAEPILSRALRVAIAVPPHLSINIAGAGIRKTIDFGELAEGERRQVRIETRSNQRFQLEVQSRNGGVLAMAPPYEASQVPYTMVLDGKAVKLPDTIGPFAGTGLAGSQFDIAFKIGGIVSKRAGLYRDEVTIEIKPVI